MKERVEDLEIEINVKVKDEEKKKKKQEDKNVGQSPQLLLETMPQPWIQPD